MQTVSFNVPSASCSICFNKIKNSMQGINGIEGINADLKSQTLKVDFDSGIISEREIKNHILDLGYEAF